MAIPESNPGLHYSTFLARLCALRGAKTYFEIGVQEGLNLSKIGVDTAVGVDPDFIFSVDPTIGKRVTKLHRTTSDSFFASAECAVDLAAGIDVAFLDGMHLFEFLLRDFYNTERLTRRNGVIAFHDCLPFDGEMIERVNDTAGRSPESRNPEAWTGDVWKVVSILREYRPDLRITLVDCHPTGLVFLSNLDPGSTVLQDKYHEIVDKYVKVENNAASLEDYYDKFPIVRAEDIIENFNHSLYFAM